MTEKKAIEISIDLWMWLHNNPGKDKQDYPGYFEKGIYKMAGGCPCCDYYYDHNNHVFNCERCPLDCCFGRNSLYRNWTAGAPDAAMVIWSKLKDYYYAKFCRPGADELLQAINPDAAESEFDKTVESVLKDENLMKNILEEK